MTSIFAVAYRGTFDQFKELFADGDEKRVRWGKSLFIEALSNTDPAQRYPMCDFLLDRDCVLDAGTTDGTNPFHILFAQCARDVNRDVALCRRLLDRGVALGQPDKNGCIPIYDVVFASPDPGFTTVVDGGKPFHKLVRAFEDRQALADRIDDYLAAGSEKHTEEHA